MASTVAVSSPRIQAAQPRSGSWRATPFAVGTTVTRIDNDSVFHTITSGTSNWTTVRPDGLFDSGEVQAGETYAHTFDEWDLCLCRVRRAWWSTGSVETPTKPSGQRRPPQQPDALTEQECVTLLDRVDVGRLAVRLADGGVDVFPVNFIIDHGTVVFCTASGTKLRSIEDDPLVAFEADEFDWYERTAWSVVVKGRASLVTDPDVLLELCDGELDVWQHDRKPFFVRITPSLTTGRRFRVHRRVEP